MTRTSSASPARSRRWTAAAIAATLVAIAGAALSWHGQARALGPGHGPMHGGWEQMEPEAMGRRIEAMTALRLADIDATPEQKSRITAIMKGAANDLASVRSQSRELRRKSAQLLAASSIDRAQLETLRLQQVQLHETASRRMLQAMMDAAEVLTPEQRAKLAEHRQRRYERR
jgi:Spy/CpxP family protein refolding chaperone